MTFEVIVSEFSKNPVLNTRQAAQFLGVHPETFQNLTATANAQSDHPRGRRRYQFGTLVLKKLKPGPNGENRDKWYLRITEHVEGKKTRRAIYVGTFQQYPTWDDAARAAEHLRMAANTEHPRPDVTMRGLMNRYIEEILRPALIPVGARENPTARVAYRTAKNYENVLKVWIRPRWERCKGYDYKVSDFARTETWEAIENWFLHSVWRSAANPTGLGGGAEVVFSGMRHMFKYAVKWGYLSLNPMKEDRVELPRGHSIRTKTPPQLTPAEFLLLLPLLCLMARVAVALAGWLGPRRNEIFGLKWQNIDFRNSAVNFVQGIVDGRINALKTEASGTNLWLPPKVLELLREWRSVTPFNRPEDWIFASEFQNQKGMLPLYPHSFLNTYIRPVALSLGLPKVSWNSFRHSVNAWAKNIDMPPDQRKILLRQKSSEVNEKYGIVELEKKRDLQQRLVSYIEGYSLRTTEPTPAASVSADAVKAIVGTRCETSGSRNSSVRSYTGRRKWDYGTIARMWVAKKTIRQIALAIGTDTKHPYRRMRCVLWRMIHKGYRDESGRMVKLPPRQRRRV